MGFVVAGCLDANAAPQNEAPPAVELPPGAHPPFTVPKPGFDFTTVIDPNHGAHHLPSLHTVGHGLKLAGHTGIGDILPEGMRGSITQIDVWDGYALVPGMEQGPAFVIVDISDPQKPKPVSYAPTIADGWTARFSKDGDYVFYGCQVVAYGNPRGNVVGDCRDPNTPHPGTSPQAGISVWDVRDKAKPKFVDFVPAAGSHNIFAESIDGVDVVVTASTEIITFDREAGKLEIVARVPGRHDATISKHPITHDWLLYTGTGELAIYNINNPAEPETVLEAGAWTGGVGWHDQVPFPAVVDGRVLLALAGENFASPQGVPGVITIADITDPANPAKLSEWHAPWEGMVPWGSYTYSEHEMAATPQGQLATSWYHGGVWVLDLSTKERQENPVTVAAYQPHEEINVTPSTFAQTPVPQVPFVWSAAWDQRGYLVIPDMHTGVYVMEPDWGLIPMRDGGA